jgi:hypothetical protein
VAQAAAGTESARAAQSSQKFVVWTSSPSDSSPHGPGRDD